jgi:hypothetical protein
VSRDGVRWERPALGIFGDTNICFKGYSGINSNTILLRPEAPPAERYALVNCEWRSMEVGGIYIAYSPDGIHWAYPPDAKPLIHGESDCNNGCVFNPDKNVYMLYMRGWHTAAVGWIKEWVGGPGVPTGPHGKNSRRRVTYAESPDLKTWSEPQVIATPDELDTNDFYGICAFRYANAYLGMLWIYDDDEMGTIDIELAWSRDGIRWDRHPQRPKFIGTGEKGEIGGYMVIPAQEPVAVGDALYFYVNEHGWYPHDAQIGPYRNAAYRARLRMDGFVSLDADRRLGCLVTRPFTLQSDRIAINAATQGGRITAELAEPWWYDPAGKPVPGFAAGDCDIFEGDSTAHVLSWRGQSDLRALKGRRLMLRLSMYHSQLYSFTL